MKNKKIVIAGGSGFIGQEMAKYFKDDNEIIVLSRQIENARNNRNGFENSSRLQGENIKYVKWDGKTCGDWWQQLEGAHIIINLAGKSVNCRYNRQNKEEILSSRINAVRAIGSAIHKCKTPPELWINAGSATIYRHSEDRPQDEHTGEIHNDFSVQVCKLWEKTFFDEDVPLTRKVNLRMAITLGSGGVLIPYFKLLKFGLGGRQGTGRQMFSWIHVVDTCRIIEWIDKNKTLAGTYNCSAPNAVTNHELMEELRASTGNHFGLPALRPMLKIGAFIIGTETELVLKSRWVYPAKLIESGFVFKYPILHSAISNIIAETPRKQFSFI